MRLLNCAPRFLDVYFGLVLLLLTDFCFFFVLGCLVLIVSVLSALDIRNVVNGDASLLMWEEDPLRGG